MSKKTIQQLEDKIKQLEKFIDFTVDKYSAIVCTNCKIKGRAKTKETTRHRII